MHEATAQHQRPQITWILIADSKQAQIYECYKTMRQILLGGANIHHYYDEKSGYGLGPVPGGTLKAESIDDYQIGHDRRGTTSSSNSSTHNTYEPHGDIKEEFKKHFLKTIASKLNKAHAAKEFDRLILVAPAKMIGGLREELSATAQHNVAAVLPKDLIHYQGQELLTHLQDTLAEAQVA